jgi:DNA helicase IV
VVRGSRRWRVPAYELEELVRELMERDIRYGAAREALPQRIAHAVLVRMEAAGEAPDDRVQDAVARNAAVKAAVKELWPPVDPAKTVLRLLSEPEFLAQCAQGVLTEEEQKEILWDRPARGVASAKWSAADAVLVDEAHDLVHRTTSLGHVVLDEAQDLSPMQYRAVGRRCSRPGRRRWRTSASRVRGSRSSPRASACRWRSSPTRPGCCPPSPRA